MSRWWTLPKRGHTGDENEDAVAASDGILAVADGATEAFFSQLWAQQLVAHLACDAAAWWDDPEATFAARVAAALAQWRSLLPPHEQLPWHAQNKARFGSAAAVAVVLFTAERWRGIAVGDVTIMHLRGETLLQSWPLSVPEDYTSRPSLVETRVRPSIAFIDDAWEPGDELLVMTDALAAWALRCARAERPLWAELRAVANAVDWDAFIGHARTAGMKNDDVTVALVAYPGSDEEPRHELPQGD